MTISIDWNANEKAFGVDYDPESFCCAPGECAFYRVKDPNLPSSGKGSSKARVSTVRWNRNKADKRVNTEILERDTEQLPEAVFSHAQFPTEDSQ